MKKVYVLPSVIIAAILVLLGVFSVSALTNNDVPLIAPNNLSVESLLSQTNSERVKLKIKALSLSEALNISAQEKASEMHDMNYFDHTNPQTGKESGLDAIEGLSIKCVYIGENLVDAKDANDAIAQWLNSKSHREAMLDSKYDLTGFGISQDPNNKTRHFVVQHFCDLK